MIHFKKVLFLLVFFFLLLTPRSVFAQNAYYFLETSAQNISPQSAFLVQVFVNSGDKPINTVRLGLQYPKENLSLMQVNMATSMFPNLVENNSSESGVLYLTAFTINPYQGERGLVATLKFQALKNGNAQITILPESKIHVADGNGTNVFNYQEMPNSFGVVIGGGYGGGGQSENAPSHEPVVLPSPAAEVGPPSILSNIRGIINKLTHKPAAEPQMLPQDVEKEKQLTADKKVVDYTASPQTKVKQLFNKLTLGKADSQTLFPIILTFVIILFILFIVIVIVLIRKFKHHNEV